MTSLTWRQEPLSKVCIVNPKKSELKITNEALPVSFVSMAAVDEQRGIISTSETRKISDVSRGFTYFREGDVLFAKITPCMENGKAAIAKGLVNGLGFGSTEFHVLRPRPGISPEWVFYFVRSKVLRMEAASRMTGSAGQQRVPTSFFDEKVIPVPPLDEQHRLTKILSEGDILRYERIKTIAETGKLIQSIFIEMFGDPMTNPKNWPIVSLEEITNLVTSGVTPRGGSQVYTKEGAYFLRSQNVQMNKLDLTDIACLPAEIHQRMSRTQICSGDVLLNITGASIGRVAWVDKLDREANVNQHVCIMRLKSDFAVPQYVSVCLSLPWNQQIINQIQSGASRQGLNHQQVRAFRIPLPPLPLQREFANRIVELQELERAQVESRKYLDQLFESLLYKSFRGEITETPRVDIPPPAKRLLYPRRQQVALALLSQLLAIRRQAVMQTQMMKYLFLTQERGGEKLGVNRLYQFQPYNYGPFSKKVYADLNTLVKKRLIDVEKRKKVRNPKDEFVLIRLTQKGVSVAQSVVSQLDQELREVICGVVSEFGLLSHEQLLNRVYELYPDYASKSVRRTLIRK